MRELARLASDAVFSLTVGAVVVYVGLRIMCAVDLAILKWRIRLREADDDQE